MCNTNSHKYSYTHNSQKCEKFLLVPCRIQSLTNGHRIRSGHRRGHILQASQQTGNYGEPHSRLHRSEAHASHALLEAGPRGHATASPGAPLHAGRCTTSALQSRNRALPSRESKGDQQSAIYVIHIITQVSSSASRVIIGQQIKQWYCSGISVRVVDARWQQ